MLRERGTGWWMAGWLRVLVLIAVSAAAVGCAPSSIIEVLSAAGPDRDPDGDGSLATARPLAFVNETAWVAAGIAVDESVPGLVRQMLGLQRGNFAPARGEVDIFSLGELDAGDEIGVTLLSVAKPLGQLLAGSDQSVVAMLLDADEAIVGFPEARGVTIENPGPYFIAIAPLVVGVPYDLIVGRRRDRPQPAPARQIVLLEFGGVTELDLLVPVGLTPVHVGSVPAFDAAAMDASLASTDEIIKETMRQSVEAIYADYNVIAVTDRAVAEGLGPYATLVVTSAPATEVLTASNVSTIGIEPRLDFENVDRSDVGLVFAGLLAVRPTILGGPHAIGVSAGLVAAHELGHAMGLLHVEESSGGLMRPVVAVDALTAGELWPRLVRARLSEMRVGIQDAPAYLARVLGRRDPAEADAIRREALWLQGAVADLPAGKAPGATGPIRCWRCGVP